MSWCASCRRSCDSDSRVTRLSDGGPGCTLICTGGRSGRTHDTSGGQDFWHLRELPALARDLDGDVIAALSDLARRAAREPDSDLARDLRAMAQLLPMSFMVLTYDGVIVDLFGRAVDRLGVEPHELIGVRLDRFGPEVAAELGHRPDGDEVLCFETGGIGPAGLPWTTQAYVFDLPERDQIVAVSIDVSDRQALADHDRAEAEEQAERFRQLAESAPIGIFIVGERSVISYVNRQLEELVGQPRDQIVGRRWLEFVHPDDTAQAWQVDVDAETSAGTPEVFEFRLLRPDGAVRWVRSRFSVLRDWGGQSVAAVGSLADVTDTIVAAQQLRESNDRTRAILEAAAEGIVTCDETARVVDFNAAAERITGFDSSEVIGRNIAMLIADDHRDLVFKYFGRLLGGAKLGTLGPREVHIRRADGEVATVELTVTEVHTSSGRVFIGMVHDISERKAFERELEHRATHDELTGLPNRVMLLAQLDAMLERARRRGDPVGVLFVGLDRLKLVTDALGHAAGDQLVLEAADRLLDVVDRQEVVSRFGGDQFVVVVEELGDVGDAVWLASRIVEALQQPFKVGDEEAFVSADVGIAIAPRGQGSAETLVSNADVAFYEARNRPDQHYDIFDVEMRAWVESHRKLEIALRYGIERDEFELHYQPIVALGSGAVVGVEALARWNHPTLGLLAPKEFIPLAEDTGLIVPLGEVLLRQACERLAAWQRSRPGLFCSVNLSGRQLSLPDLVPKVARAIESAGAEPNGLHIELTETMLLRDVDAAVASLVALKEIGVKICLDDFGTGYSSLSYLGRFPIETLKVDRSFVSRLGTDGPEASIVAMVVGMAGALDLDVVAEGVESRLQLDALRNLGCPYGQGFLFARPQPWTDVELVFDSALVDG